MGAGLRIQRAKRMITLSDYDPITGFCQGQRSIRPDEAILRSTRASDSGGFMASTMDVGMRIVAPRSYVVIIDDIHRAQLKGG